PTSCRPHFEHRLLNLRTHLHLPHVSECALSQSGPVMGSAFEAGSLNDSCSTSSLVAFSNSNVSSTGELNLRLNSLASIATDFASANSFEPCKNQRAARKIS